MSILLLILSYYMNYSYPENTVSTVKRKKINVDTKYESSIEDVNLSFLSDKLKVTIKADTTKKIKEQVFLQNISGRLESDDGHMVEFKASKGMMKLADKKLYLTQGACIYGKEIGRISTEEVVIDYNNYSVSTDGIVTVDNDEMFMLATGLDLTDKGKKIKFKKVTVKFK